jgi:serine/threonine-protein phosphatase 2A regulatory subunit A
MQSQAQPMDIDPVDDGPVPLPSPVAAPVPTRSATSPTSVPPAITKEEEARQAIEMMRSEDLSARVLAAHRLDEIAAVLGPERTREVRKRRAAKSEFLKRFLKYLQYSFIFVVLLYDSQELIPFVTDGVDDEDEVLLALGNCLGKMVEHVGGPLHAHTLLRPLELLLTVEETLVRETATNSCQQIADQLPTESFQNDYAAMIRRLAATEWFTARISSAGLLAAAHSRLTDPEQRTEHVKLFSRLCSDDTPMVRRVAAQYLGKLLLSVVETDGREVLQPEGLAMKVLLPLYEAFASPDQPDSVRLQTAENCVAFGTVLSSFLTDEEPSLSEAEMELLQRVLPLIVSTIDDRSWRVRWTAAAKFAAVVSAYDRLPNAMDALVPAYEKLLQDPEAEVRTAATLNLAQVARCQARVAHQDGTGAPVSVAERLVKRITSLTEDDSEHVRAALAMVATELAPVLGRDATIMYLVPPVLLLLRDAASEVRLNLISSLSALNEVIGVDLLSQSLLPAILDLAQDGKWRIRLAIIENIPLLARQLGKDFFTEKLSSLCVDWLGDDIASIRKAAAKNLKVRGCVVDGKALEIDSNGT